MTSQGTILEAAFVDPAYSWPPEEGKGPNAVELQASNALMEEKKETKPEPEVPAPAPKATATSTKKSSGGCCGGKSATTEAIVDNEEEMRKAREHEREAKAAAEAKALEEAQEREEKNTRVPEGVLIYKLDTLEHTIKLVSGVSSNTDMENLFEGMIVAAASSSNDAHRRGICLTSVDGEHATLVACDQRTAIAWLEAIEMMLTRTAGKAASGKQSVTESEYLSLTAYSNNLIRTGATPGGAGKATGGIFYSVENQTAPGDDFDEETLESVAKRRAVIKDSWDFYRMICSLLRDRKKYEEVFDKIKLDPVYPYLNSMTGLADPGDNGYENFDKQVVQKSQPEYSDMSQAEIAKDLVKRAEEAMPSLVEICKALAGSLGMEEVGVGTLIFLLHIFQVVSFKAAVFYLRMAHFFLSSLS